MTHFLIFTCATCKTERQYGAVDELAGIERDVKPIIYCANCNRATRHAFSRTDFHSMATQRMRPRVFDNPWLGE